MLILGAGPGDIGALAAAQTLHFLLLSIPFGLAADRPVETGADGRGRSVARPGAGRSARSGAAPALVPARVPRSALAQANGRLELARSVAFTAGPALAGAMVSPVVRAEGWRPAGLRHPLLRPMLAWPTGALAGLSFFLFGAVPIIWVITFATLRQSVTPDGMLGHVSALFLTVNAGARPVGARWAG